ncbi:MAG: DUF1232 domain-containing protein [Cyclobacteriaceae bacterium]
MTKKKRIDKILAKAKTTVTQNERVKTLLSEVRDRIDSLSQNSEERSSFVNQVLIVVRMIKAHYNKEYTAFSATTILSLVFSMVYFITPIDLIPDFIPALGLTDDISLFYFIFKNLAEDISAFKDWEEGIDEELEEA